MNTAQTSLTQPCTNAADYYEDVLQQYASGCLPESLRLVVACHAALSEVGRNALCHYEALGGALLAQSCGEMALKPDALQRVLARLPDIECAKSAAIQAQEKTKNVCTCLPEVLLAYTNNTVNNLPWKSVLPGVEIVEVPLASGCRDQARLLRMKPGVSVPEHAHRGLEYTLVLDGAFHDQTGVFARGDLVIHDDRVVHTPHADKDRGCICLAVTTAPLRFTGFLGPFLNFFNR